MALQTLHPCAFAFGDQDIRIVGNVVDGGTSLSGISDPNETTGGGYWRADFSNGSTRTREQGLAWRALTAALDGGATAVNVRLCERLFAPVLPMPRPLPHDADAILADDSEPPRGAAYVTAAAAPLRATTLVISGDSERALLGGELFSIEHPTWGHRAYRVIAVAGNTLTIRPPLREAVGAGTALEFDYPRCRMRLAGTVSNPTSGGRYTSCALAFVEDMRKPAA